MSLIIRLIGILGIVVAITGLIAKVIVNTNKGDDFFGMISGIGAAAVFSAALVISLIDKECLFMKWKFKRDAHPQRYWSVIAMNATLVMILLFCIIYITL